jgi:energy-coupling factor transporter ATP-binding protein EcfA2
MLRMAARMSGFREEGREEAVLARVGLSDAADRKARTFSMGMRQRLALGAALLARPELLILDEPTNGLDPAGIQEMRTLVRELVDQRLHEDRLLALACDHAVSLGQLTHQRQQGRSHLLRLQGVKVVCGDHGRR